MSHQLSSQLKALRVADRYAERIIMGAATGVEDSTVEYTVALEAVRRALPDYDEVNRIEQETAQFLGGLMCLYQDAGVLLGIALGRRMSR